MEDRGCAVVNDRCAVVELAVVGAVDAILARGVGSWLFGTKESLFGSWFGSCRTRYR